MKITIFDNPIVVWCPSRRNLRDYPRTFLSFLEAWIIGLHFAADNMGLSSFNFLQRVSIALAMQSAVLAMIDSVWPSNRLTVRHSPVSCQNDSSYDHAVFTGG